MHRKHTRTQKTNNQSIRTTHLLRLLGFEVEDGGHLIEGDVLVDSRDGDQVVLHHCLVQDAVPVTRHLEK